MFHKSGMDFKSVLTLHLVVNHNPKFWSMYVAIIKKDKVSNTTFIIDFLLVGYEKLYANSK